MYTHFVGMYTHFVGTCSVGHCSMMEEVRFSIEAAGLRDLSALTALEKVCFSQDAWQLWDLAGVLLLPGIVRLKAVIAGEMVGFISGDQNRLDGIGWITTLGVQPAHRRHGIAWALLAECEQRMRARRVRLSVRRSNLAAYCLYRRAGYHQVGVWERYYADGEDALVLEKAS